MNGIPTFRANTAQSLVKRNELNRVVIDNRINEIYVILDKMNVAKKKKNRALYNKTRKLIDEQLNVLNIRLQSDFSSGRLDSQGMVNAYSNRIELLKQRILSLFSIIFNDLCRPDYTDRPILFVYKRLRFYNFLLLFTLFFNNDIEYFL